MATATLLNTPTVISLCESITGWSGDTFALNTDFPKQGTNTVACAMTTNGVNNIQYATTNSPGGQFAATNIHIRIWVNLSFVGDIDTDANDGIQLQVISGAGTALYTVGGSTTYSGGWKQYVIYTGNTPTTGSTPSGTCTAVGLTVNTTAKPRNQPANCYVDAWYFGDGFRVTGGTSGDEINWSHLAALDLIEAYGIVTEIEGVYFLAGDIEIGDGSTTTYWASGQKCVFKDLPVLSTLYQIHFSGSGLNVDINGGSWGVSGSAVFWLLADDATINSFSLQGKQIEGLSAGDFHAGATIKNCVFDKCAQVDPSTALFTNNTLSNSVDTGGAVLFPSDSVNFHTLQIINCDNGIEYDATSDSTSPQMASIVFDDEVGNYDVNNTSGGAVTFILSGTSNGNSSQGSAVTFSNPKIFSFTVAPSITGYEWRIYNVTAIGSMAGSSEQDGEENATADNQTYPYTYAGDQAIAVQIISQPDEDYEEIISYYTLTATNQDVIIGLTEDNNN